MALITLRMPSWLSGMSLCCATGFSLETNERVGLIGRNGAGKLSLLKILGGLAEARLRHAASAARHPHRLCGARTDLTDVTIFQAVLPGLGARLPCATNTWPTPGRGSGRLQTQIEAGRRLELGSAWKKPCSACT